MNPKAILAIAAISVFFAACIPEVTTPSTTSWYQDTDGDDYGDQATEFVGDQPDNTYVTDNTDCDDTAAAINPDAIEIENTVDDNCDGVIDEGFVTYYKDSDGDGFGDLSVTSDGKPDNTYVTDNTDCDDTAAAINPAGSEVNDPYDNDCDGVVNNAPFAIGDYGPAGGIVFQTDGTNGLEAAPEDQNIGIGGEWGCDGVTVSADSLTDGMQNTIAMLAANCSPNTAGKPLAVDLVNAYSLNSYDDWFLPSQDELAALYAQKDNVGGFSTYYYWSSSRVNAAAGAWYQSFDDGNPDFTERFASLYVRSVRAF